jgi:hypothetical protein
MWGEKRDIEKLGGGGEEFGDKHRTGCEQSGDLG